MSDKLTAIKIKYPNGTYSEQILLSVLAENVQVNSTTTLSDALDLIDARIDQIVAPTSSTLTLDEEVRDIRVGKDATRTSTVNYASAGAAVRTQLDEMRASLDDDISDLKNTVYKSTGNKQIPVESGAYIALNGSTANINAPVTSASSKYAIVECVEGDIFTVSTTGGNAGRAYGFISSNGEILQVANASVTITNKLLTAPENSAYLIINAYNANIEAYYGKYLIDKVNNLSAALKNGNAYDVLRPNATYNNGGSTLTFEWNVDKTVCTFVGSSENNFFTNLIVSGTELPDGFIAGNTYYATQSTTDDNITLQIFIYKNNTTTNGEKIEVTNETVEFTLPSNCTGIVIRLYVAKNTQVNGVVSDLSILNAKSNKQLKNQIDNLTSELESTAVTFGGTLPSGTDLNNVKGVVKYYTLLSSLTYTNTPPGFNAFGGILFVYKTYSNSNTLQRFISIDPQGKNWQRFYISVQDKWTSWNDTFSNIDSVKDINTTLSMFDIKDLMWENINPSNKTSAGVSWTVDKSQKSITADSNGSAPSGVAFVNLHYDLSALPSWLKKGKRYFAQINSENVYFEIFYHNNDTNVDTWLFSTNKPIEFVIPNEATNLVIRLRIKGDVVVDEIVTPFISEAMTLSELTDKVYHRSLKILFMGHSLLQDECTYVPWILESVAPDLDLTMSIAYKDSAWISKTNGFNAHFDDTTYKMSIYSEYNSGDTKWTNSRDTYTIKEALDLEEWDVIVICESLLHNTTEGVPSSDTTHFTALGEFVDKIINYVKHPLKIGVIFPHDRYCTNNYQTVVEKPTTYTEGITQYKNYIWDAYPVEFFIPGFTAYWNARGTVLDEYGDQDYHHMFADYGHYQQGIGCLIGSYTSAAVLLSIAGFDNRSIFGDQLPITSQWISDHEIPGQNLGPQSRPTGIEEENLARNRLIAQKCAIMAIKNPWEISTIS